MLPVFIYEKPLCVTPILLSSRPVVVIFVNTSDLVALNKCILDISCLVLSIMRMRCINFMTLLKGKPDLTTFGNFSY